MCPTNSPQSICGIATTHYTTPKPSRLHLCPRSKATILSALFTSNLVPQTKKDLDAHAPLLEDVYRRCGLDHLYQPRRLRGTIYSKFLDVVPGLVHEAKKGGAVMKLMDGRWQWGYEVDLGTVEGALAWWEGHKGAGVSHLAMTTGTQSNDAPLPALPPTATVPGFPSRFESSPPMTPSRSHFPLDSSYGTSSRHPPDSGVASLASEILSGALSPRSATFPSAGGGPSSVDWMTSPLPCTPSATTRGDMYLPARQDMDVPLPDINTLPAVPSPTTPTTRRLAYEAGLEGDGLFSSVARPLFGSPLLVQSPTQAQFGSAQQHLPERGTPPPRVITGATTTVSSEVGSSATVIQGPVLTDTVYEPARESISPVQVVEQYQPKPVGTEVTGVQQSPPPPTNLIDIDSEPTAQPRVASHPALGSPITLTANLKFNAPAASPSHSPQPPSPDYPNPQPNTHSPPHSHAAQNKPQSHQPTSQPPPPLQEKASTAGLGSRDPKSTVLALLDSQVATARASAAQHLAELGRLAEGVRERLGVVLSSSSLTTMTGVTGTAATGETGATRLQQGATREEGGEKGKGGGEKGEGEAEKGVVEGGGNGAVDAAVVDAAVVRQMRMHVDEVERLGGVIGEFLWMRRGLSG
ncbi:hypothetical protein CONLIGDRAFT_686803 [Coniochaeta ligniaria NRRL 30616]|uniref:Uncharacterized protein n=1 Tax=Coniochaeta ligniaria NRRL 30616 TaxID=1408157 RepID=A0A1J7I6U5_9PEZI|nr:hypothetical protein CONLIGDRAFT_686803 [Coniochaeta ligniaria NRRL 30616]